MKYTCGDGMIAGYEVRLARTKIVGSKLQLAQGNSLCMNPLV
jgi:hypothetical protein